MLTEDWNLLVRKADGKPVKVTGMHSNATGGSSAQSQSASQLSSHPTEAIGLPVPERSHSLLGLMPEERLKEALEALQQWKAEPHSQLLDMHLNAGLLQAG